MTYRIVIDRVKCQGIGACVAGSRRIESWDKQGKAIVIDPEGSDDDNILEAAEACPLEAIELYDETGIKSIRRASRSPCFDRQGSNLGRQWRHC